MCAKCHGPRYREWQQGAHGRSNGYWDNTRGESRRLGRTECHGAEEDEADAYEHFDHIISVIVSPKDCARCDSREANEFMRSRHAKAGRIIGSLDNILAEVVEGNAAFRTPGFRRGNAASAVLGCWQCHGSQVKTLEDGELDAATWPNTGIGRINPDGSEGACTACHLRHEFAASQARRPESCGRCQLGPDHPQKEIYEESKHGINFLANIDKMNLDSPKWIVGEDYWEAPTCATCHISATKTQPVTHDVGMRISWNNRPVFSIRPEVADAQLGLPGKDVPWHVRRENMKDVCSSCHSQTWVDNFYTQYDGLIDLYNRKFAEPGKALYELAKPLLNPVTFSNKLDWVWYELWHHEGRRARHGAAMMGPAYTHWYGTYEVAKTFYTELVPELQRLADANIDSDDPEKATAATALKASIAKTLETKDHRWYIDKMDPKEKERRIKVAKEFRARYKK